MLSKVFLTVFIFLSLVLLSRHQNSGHVTLSVNTNFTFVKFRKFFPGLAISVRIKRGPGHSLYQLLAAVGAKCSGCPHCHRACWEPPYPFPPWSCGGSGLARLSLAAAPCDCLGSGQGGGCSVTYPVPFQMRQHFCSLEYVVGRYPINSPLDAKCQTLVFLSVEPLKAGVLLIHPLSVFQDPHFSNDLNCRSPGSSCWLRVQVKATGSCVSLFLSILIMFKNNIKTLPFIIFLLRVCYARYIVSSISFCGVARDIK